MFIVYFIVTYHSQPTYLKVDHMEVIYIAEPIISTDINKLIAIKVLSRFYSPKGHLLSTERVLSIFTTTMKINLVKSQINTIIKHRDFLNVIT